MLSRVILPAMLLLATSALSDEAITIDGATTESYERSVRGMVDSLSEEDKEVFARGLFNMIITDYPAADPNTTGFGLLATAPAALNAAHITMNGRTIAEILDRGREIAERSQAAGAMSAATAPAEEASPDPAAALLECLQAAVTTANAELVADPYSSAKQLRLEVTNGLSWAIAGLWFGYEIYSEGRSVPWVEDRSIQSIPGGIEPGETREVETRVNLVRGARDPFVIQIRMLNVSDAQKRLLVPGAQVMDWSDELSDQPCVPPAN